MGCSTTLNSLSSGASTATVAAPAARAAAAVVNTLVRFWPGGSCASATTSLLSEAVLPRPIAFMVSHKPSAA
eukprot:CAMPEP_0174713454 /NCGR_PEP_ID=MMETSP1094-20130205/14115_1 /TAXON_ID=156173 /ORGANISM="Chrysochromulina brevifilum, Strain UTEX LB 985" /LENGTH=71 /DNA_ID=CAMNT_0015912633 /DNA_START=452 /DNA_END=667 /DNA_ORIENTATION=-